MKCLLLFSVKNKKNIICLSSAVLAQRVVKVKASIAPGKGSVQKIFCFCTEEIPLSSQKMHFYEKITKFVLINHLLSHNLEP